MADIRINSLPTTASASSSDDYIALDGTTNGTRKLNAYSPTFGGNLTLSGTTSTITLGSTNTANVAVNSSGALTVTSANGQTLVSQTSSGNHYVEIKRASQSTGQVGLSLNGGTSGNTWLMYQPVSSNTLTWFGNSVNRMSLDTSGNLTLNTGNLTVSGGQALTIGSSANYSLWKDGTPTKAGRVILNNTVTNGLSLGLYDGSSWVETLHIHPTNNNVLIGGTIDGGQKLQVSGTAYVSGDLSSAGIITSAGANDGYFTATRSTTSRYALLTYKTGSSDDWVIGLRGSGEGFSDDLTYRNGSGTVVSRLSKSGNATFAGSIAIGNTVQTAVSVASTHKVTISIGGSTYYLLATNV